MSILGCGYALHTNNSLWSYLPTTLLKTSLQNDITTLLAGHHTQSPPLTRWTGSYQQYPFLGPVPCPCIFPAGVWHWARFLQQSEVYPVNTVLQIYHQNPYQGQCQYNNYQYNPLNRLYFLNLNSRHIIGYTKQKTECCLQIETSASRFYIWLEKCTKQTCTDADHQALCSTSGCHHC